jgi:hypothetical protein
VGDKRLNANGGFSVGELWTNVNILNDWAIMLIALFLILPVITNE